MLQLRISYIISLICFSELCCNSKSVRLFWVVLWIKIGLNSFLSCFSTQNQFEFFFELCCNSNSVWILVWVVLQLKSVSILFWVVLQIRISESVGIIFRVVLQLKINLNCILSCVASQDQFEFFFEFCCNSKPVWILLRVVLQLKSSFFLVVLQLQISLNSFLSCVATQNQLISLNSFWDVFNSKCVWILLCAVLQLKISLNAIFSCVATHNQFNFFFELCCNSKNSLNSFLSCVATQNRFEFFFELCCNSKSLFCWVVLQLKITWISFFNCVETQNQLIRQIFF